MKLSVQHESTGLVGSIRIFSNGMKIDFSFQKGTTKIPVEVILGDKRIESYLEISGLATTNGDDVDLQLTLSAPHIKIDTTTLAKEHAKVILEPKPTSAPVRNNPLPEFPPAVSKEDREYVNLPKTDKTDNKGTFFENYKVDRPTGATNEKVMPDNIESDPSVNSDEESKFPELSKELVGTESEVEIDTTEPIITEEVTSEEGSEEAEAPAVLKTLVVTQQPTSASAKGKTKPKGKN